MEALEAYVQPEVLNGSNQYFCERCAKKCDAHKVSKCSISFRQVRETDSAKTMNYERNFSETMRANFWNVHFFWK